MKIVLAPNAFKESLSAPAAAAAMRRGFANALPDAELIEHPVADGGDGTAEVLRRALGGKRRTIEVTGALGAPVEAGLTELAGASPKTFVIEVAETGGLAQVPIKRRNPMKTTSRGLGEAILIAARRGAERIIIGLGGSATVDGGIGMAQAMGFALIDARSRPVRAGGEGLERLACIVPSEHVIALKNRAGKAIEIVVACDVKNRLLGPKGAAAVFGPQKGATPRMVERLDVGLTNLANLLKRDLGRSVRRLKSGGAAGGLAAGLSAFLGAELRSGAELVLEASGFDESLDGADLVVTGEGRLDTQTLGDKAPAVVARWAAGRGVPTIGLAGSVAPELLGAKGSTARRSPFAACFSIVNGPMSLAQAMAEASAAIERTAYQVGRAAAQLGMKSSSARSRK